MLCKLDGDDSPGALCETGAGIVECSNGAPVFSAVLASHIEGADRD